MPEHRDRPRGTPARRHVGRGVRACVVLACAAAAAGAAAPTAIGFGGATTGTTLTGTASADVVVGGAIHDTATLDGGIDPTGTITFQVYGPGDADCSGTPLATSTQTVAGTGPYDSDPLTTARVGAYRWVATYSGDTLNDPSSTTCNDAGQSDAATMAQPTVAASASGAVPAGGQVHASATLAGGYQPGGSIELKLYGPGDPSCTGSPLATSTRTVNGAGSYDSDSVTVAHAGTYRWVAEYGGDESNSSTGSGCTDSGASVAVTRAATGLSETASGAVAVGGRLTDRATLSSGAAPGGTITFKLYGPNDPSCSRAPVATSTAAVKGAGGYGSDPVTPAHAGGYRWVVDYGGDSDNLPSHGSCSDPGAQVTVGKAQVTLTTHASASAVVGASIGDRAQLGGGAAPTGTITFRLYGPGDATCSRAPVASATAAVEGSGGYASGPVTPKTPGDYRWVAVYSGDADNAPASGACGDPRETTTVKDVDHTTTTFDTNAPGDALLALTAAAPGTDWGVTGRESATATVTVDGRYCQDVVLFRGDQPFTYRVALGWLGAGRHTVHVRYNSRKSTAGARGVVVQGMQARRGGASEALALRYAPILYGRDNPSIPTHFENNHTDVPLLLYHTTMPDSQGTTIAYTMIWSGEDGGTAIDAMMPRWGRTTDIEWVYRVRLDSAGNFVSDEYQDPRHHKYGFDGLRDHGHPLLVTGAANNGVEPVHGRADETGYRFFLDASSSLGRRLARETEMDMHPWTYAVSATEAAREHKFELHSSPLTKTISDPRHYLFVRLAKHTTESQDHGWVGTSIDIKLRNRSTWYESNHGVADWSVEPDGQVTTSVELPSGTSEEDVQALRAVADPVGNVSGDWHVRINQIATAFSLDNAYRPLRWSQPRHVGVTMTAQHRSRWIWTLRAGTGSTTLALP